MGKPAKAVSGSKQDCVVNLCRRDGLKPPRTVGGLSNVEYCWDSDEDCSSLTLLIRSCTCLNYRDDVDQ